MSNVFVRLYLLIVATVIVIGIGLDFTWQSIEPSNNENQLELQYVQLATFQLDRQPSLQLKSYLDELNNKYGKRLQLIEDSSPEAKSMVSLLSRQKIVWVQDEEADFALTSLTNHPYILQISFPVEQQTSSIKYGLIVVFYGLIAIVIFFWFWPLSNDLNLLETAVKEFDQHQWQSKVNLPTTSSINHLAKAYNGLLDKIKLLVETQQSMSHAISHELRTPLARVRFSLQMALENDDIEQVKNQLTSIEDDISEMNDLISELLNFATLENSTSLANLEKGNLRQLVENLVVRLKLRESNIDIKFESEQMNDLVRCDSYLMERAIQNLLVNAVKFANKAILIQLDGDNDNYYLCICDDGSGVAEANRTKIFESFVQLNDENKSKGFGLGLAIVKRVMSLHNGSVEVTHSNLGGAKFILSWPKQ
jgi:two-component system OmpR family sensor kinase